MTRRWSSETTGPCADDMTRSGRYRWRSRSAASSSSRKASGLGRDAVSIILLPLRRPRRRYREPSAGGFNAPLAIGRGIPVHDHLAGIAGAGGREGELVGVERESVG